MTIETIKRDAEVTDEQLNTTVEETDLFEMLSQSDITHDDYLETLGLSAGQQTNVMSHSFVPGTQDADHDVMNAPEVSHTISTLTEVPMSKLVLMIITRAY